MTKKILVAVDLNERSDLTDILHKARRIAIAEEGELNVMTVIPPIGGSWVSTWFKDDAEEKMLQEANAALHRIVAEALGDGVKVRHIVAQGSVYEEVLAMAEQLEIDLIVIGAHRPDFKDYLLGPNAARVARHSKCSVYIVRE